VGRTQVLSLATPADDPTGISTGGGTLVTLRGVNFGTVAQGPSTLGLVTYSPVGLPLQFGAQQCRVTVDHVEIQCVTGPGVGARLLWTVTVDGLGSTYPRTSYQGPVISSLGTPWVAGSFVACFRGGLLRARVQLAP
jgi:hypothetical protein